MFQCKLGHGHGSVATNSVGNLRAGQLAGSCCFDEALAVALNIAGCRAATANLSRQSYLYSKS